ncbi:MAG: hypothetical protein KIT84_30135 [Labilithrix sp.]|nr:hypothetical protein [Labilithrix sp.]MCW5815324.1 hypothetical protein [Labilithrix sp.]
MKRVALAVLGVVLAVAVMVLIARRGDEENPASPAGDAAAEAALAEEPYDAAGDLVLDVKELELGDGALNQRSIRVDHPDQAMQAKLREWLAAREEAAVATGAAIDCHAQTAKTSFVSITCSSLDAETDAGAPDAAKPTVKYESITLRVVRGKIEELTLADVLMPNAGEAEVIAACKKSADPPLPCVWPPTSFAVSPGGTLFLCHGSSCVDVDGDAELLRPELR